MACIIMYCQDSFFQTVKGLTICLGTRSDGYLLTCKISGSLELWLVRFMFSKDYEDDEKSVKIMFTCISYLV